MSTRGDVPGNSLASAAEYQRQMVKSAEQLMRLEAVLDRLDEQGTFVLGMSIKVKGFDRNDYLVVLRAQVGNERVVSFHTGDTFLEAVRGMAARLENGSVKWKEDSYAQ